MATRKKHAEKTTKTTRTTKAAKTSRTAKTPAAKPTKSASARAVPAKPNKEGKARAGALPPGVARYREFVLSLPEAKEEIKWGSPHYTVMGKIFSGLSEDEGDYYSGVVVHPDLAASLVDDVLFSVAPYTGRYGGITMNVSKVPLEQAQELVRMSYCRSAPARLVALLEGGGEGGKKAAKKK
jgi:hypothetical protein